MFYIARIQGSAEGDFQKMFFCGTKKTEFYMRILLVGFFVFWFSLIQASKIALVTMAIGDKYQEAVAVSIENKRAYCEKLGYDFIVLNESLDQSRPVPWSKILLVQQILESNQYDWIFWSDADSLIMNYNIPLETFIDDTYDLILTRDFNDINSGQFFLKNCNWSKIFLSDVYAHTECINHPWWEQMAISYEMSKPEVSSRTKICPQRDFNSYCLEFHNYEIGGFKQGDFVIHFIAVRDLGVLKFYLNKYCDRVLK